MTTQKRRDRLAAIDRRNSGAWWVLPGTAFVHQVGSGRTLCGLDAGPRALDIGVMRVRCADCTQRAYQRDRRGNQ